MADHIDNFSSSVANTPAIQAFGIGAAIIAQGGEADGGAAIIANCPLSGTGSAAIIANSDRTAIIASSSGGLVTVIINGGGETMALQVDGKGGGAASFLGQVSILGEAVVTGTARLQSNVTVDGDITMTGADCAEEFDIAIAAEIEPGTVVALDQDGTLHQSLQAYDKRVAGVISGAGDYKPGFILDRQQSRDNRLPVALVGKVYCKVDAQYAPIEVGDLLTTSSTPGHAMKADDPFKAFGSVIGKALRPLKTGQGMIPILIALQ